MTTAVVKLLVSNGIRYFHNDSWLLPRDYHELTSIIRFSYATYPQDEDQQQQCMWYVVLILFEKASGWHVLMSKVPACQYNQILEVLDPLATII